MSHTEDQRFYGGLALLLERFIEYAFNRPDAYRYRGPAYDPYRTQGDGRTCPRCRRSSLTGARICRYCHAILGR